MLLCSFVAMMITNGVILMRQPSLIDAKSLFNFSGSAITVTLFVGGILLIRSAKKKQAVSGIKCSNNPII